MCTKNHSLFPFVSDPNLPAINVNVTEGRNNLWSKTKRAFAYMYEHHKDEADWFLKADDDTYTVVENLRYMLQPYDASKPIYFGCKFKPYVSQGYMSGGAGYVLSKEALRRFVKQGIYPFSSLYENLTNYCEPKQSQVYYFFLLNRNTGVPA